MEITLSYREQKRNHKHSGWQTLIEVTHMIKRHEFFCMQN